MTARAGRSSSFTHEDRPDRETKKVSWRFQRLHPSCLSLSGHPSSSSPRERLSPSLPATTTTIATSAAVASSSASRSVSASSSAASFHSLSHAAAHQQQKSGVVKEVVRRQQQLRHQQKQQLTPGILRIFKTYCVYSLFTSFCPNRITLIGRRH